MKHPEVVIDALSSTIIDLRSHVHSLEQELESCRDQILELLEKEENERKKH